MAFQNNLVRKKPFWLTKSYVWVHIIPSEGDVSNSGYQSYYGAKGLPIRIGCQSNFWAKGLPMAIRPSMLFGGKGLDDSDWLEGLFGGEGFADGEDGERDGWEIQGGLEGVLVEVADYQASKAEIDGLEAHRLERHS